MNGPGCLGLVISFLLIAVPAGAQGPPDQQPFISYSIGGTLAPTGEAPSDFISKQGCVGTITPDLPFFYAGPPCSSDTQLNANVPWSASEPGPNCPSCVLFPSSITATGQTTGNLGGLKALATSKVSGMLAVPPSEGGGVIRAFGGMTTEVLFYQHNIPSAVSPGFPLQLRFHLIGAKSGTARYSVSVRLVSDSNEVDFSVDDSFANGPVTPPQPLIIGPSQKYSISISMQAVASARGNGESSSQVEFLMKSYVALGDSYASGDGVPPYGPSPTDVECARSLQAFPIQMNLPLGLVFGACAGATTGNLLSAAQYPDQPVQLDLLGSDAAPSSEVSLVTVMIGGNDIGLVAVFEACLASSLPNLPCASLPIQGTQGNFVPINQVMDLALQALDGKLATVYGEIKKRAPNARLFVLLYPNPFRADLPICPSLGGGLGLSLPNTQYLASLGDRLNSHIRNVASAFGTVVDLNSPGLRNHTLCDNDLDTWFVKLRLAPTSTTETAHPNAQGEAEITRIVLDAINGSAPGFSANVGPGQTASTTVNVAPGQGSASFSSSWPGSDVVMTLISPSGTVINRSTNSTLVTHYLGSTYEAYRVLLPEPGTWTVQLFGANVAAQGEPVSFNFAMLPRAGGDVDGDGSATCADLAIVKAAFGKRRGQAGFDPRADLNNDGVIDVRDLSLVSQNILSGTTCQ